MHYCLIVPSAFKAQALELAHSQVGHLGQKKTLAKAEETFYWPNLKSDVRTFVKDCLTCQQFKGAPGLQQQWLELPSVERPLERVSLDLTDMVAGNQGYRYVLSITDHYSRYVKFSPLKTKNTEKVCECLSQYISDFGVLRVVLERTQNMSKLREDVWLKCYSRLTGEDTKHVKIKGRWFG